MDKNSENKRQWQGWTSPSYTQSIKRDLNLDLLKENRCLGYSPLFSVTEYYKMLKTQIQQKMQANNWNTLMVTSIHSGEGNTITAINMSLVFAKEFSSTVLLVDCDFRNQQIHKYLGIESDRGMVDYIVAGTPLNELIIWPGIEKFTIISGGSPIVDSTELLNSPRMKSIIPEIKNRYNDRYVFFDVPALLEGADALAFIPLVQGIIVVLESGKTTRQDILRAMELIPRDKFIGFVLNKQPMNH